MKSKICFFQRKKDSLPISRSEKENNENESLIFNLNKFPTFELNRFEGVRVSKYFDKLEGTQQHVPSGAEVRVVSASVIAQLQAQGLQVRFIK